MLVCTWGLAKNMTLKWEYSVVSEEGHGIHRWYQKYIITMADFLNMKEDAPLTMLQSKNMVSPAYSDSAFLLMTALIVAG